MKPDDESSSSSSTSTTSSHGNSSKSDDGSSSSSGEENDDSTPPPSWPPPVIHHREGTVEFSAEAVHEQLVCFLCEGFYRDPFTTTKCRHTFCRSCLVTAVDAGGRSTCPKCDTYLGKDVFKFALPDHVIRVITDKVLFPDVAAEDAKQEAEFYRKRGIDPKVVEEPDEGTGEDYKNRLAPPRKKSTREVTLEVIPDEEDSNMPALDCPILRTESSIRVGQIKKYLILKLKTEAPIEVMCHGTPLGDELSVAFVLRTVWMERSKHLVLTYCRGSDEKG